MNGSSRPKRGPNAGPKMEANSRPKRGPNAGLKMGRNPGVGIGGLSIGQGTQGRGQKMSVPCSSFRNTQNTERVLNTALVANGEVVLNTEREFEFKSADDILELLRTHPDFERAPKEYLQPIVAAILSGLMAAGGIALLVCAPGIGAGATTALVIKAIGMKAAGGALLAGGMAGAENALKHGVRGTFTWTSWTCDVALSASTVVLTMGAASFSAWGYTSHGFALLVEARNLTVDTLANLAKAAKAVAAAVGGLASAAGEALKKVIKDEKISPVMLVLCLITGALQGYKVGADIPDAVIRQKVEAMTKSCQALSENLATQWTSQKNFWNHAIKHGTKKEMAGKLDVLADYDPEKAKSCTILSRETVEALQNLEKASFNSEYAGMAHGIADSGDPYLKHILNGRVNFNYVYWHKNFYVVTSVHAADPLNNPDKIVTMFYMNDAKFHDQILKALSDSKSVEVFK